MMVAHVKKVLLQGWLSCTNLLYFGFGKCVKRTETPGQELSDSLTPLIGVSLFDVKRKSENNNSFCYLVDPASGICLSQRLSHASLSISYMNDETANGSVKQQ